MARVVTREQYFEGAIELLSTAGYTGLKQATLCRVQRATSANQAFGPALLGVGAVRSEVTVRGNTASYQHHRRTACTNQFIAQAQRTLPCMTHAQLQLDLAAHRGDAVIDTVE